MEGGILQLMGFPIMPRDRPMAGTPADEGPGPQLAPAQPGETTLSPEGPMELDNGSSSSWASSADVLLGVTMEDEAPQLPSAGSPASAPQQSWRTWADEKPW